MIRTLVIASALLGAGIAASSPANAQDYNHFRQTCPQVWQNGPVVQAVCLNAFGQGVRTAIDTRSCGGAPIGNANGRLVCDYNQFGGGGGWRRNGYGGGGYGGWR